MATRALLLALALFHAVTIGLVQGDQVLRLAYKFSFEDEGLLDVDREPTKEEVEAVLCQTNVFFSKSFQKLFGNPKIAVVTKEADFAFVDYQFEGEGGVVIEMPAHVNFTLDIMTLDGANPPTFAEIQDALPTLDYNAYLTKFVWRAAPVTKNYFFEARGLVW